MPANDPNEMNLDKAGRGLVNQLAAIIRTAQIHDPSNVAVVQAIDRLVVMLAALHAEGSPVGLELVGEYFYLNENRIKFSMEHLVNFDHLVREFKKVKLGSVTFNQGVSPSDVQGFLKAFIAASFAADPFGELSDGTASIRTLTIGAPRKEKQKVESGPEDMRKTVKHTYFNAVSFTRGVMKKIKSGERIDVKRAKRVVQSLVDVLLQEEELMMGMTAIKDYDDYTYHHSVNVSIVSISVGQKLGFSKQMLLELGLVALFHDIGKTEVPPEVLNKPGAFTPEEWQIIKRHPIWGVRAILGMKGFDDISMRAAIVAFEHHIRPDGQGYPDRRFSKGLDLYSRIVSLSDQYDGMTSARVYSRSPMTPEKALSLMMERAGAQLDPLLFKFFVNMVGVYPVGCAVMLGTRQLALVYGNNMMFPDRPRVMVISDAKGKKIPGQIVDLAEKNEQGTFRNAILKTLDPNKYKINLAEYLL